MEEASRVSVRAGGLARTERNIVLVEEEEEEEEEAEEAEGSEWTSGEAVVTEVSRTFISLGGVLIDHP